MSHEVNDKMVTPSAVVMPDEVLELIQSHGPITLGAAKRLAASLPPEQQKLGMPCGCRNIICSTESSCCPGKSPCGPCPCPIHYVLCGGCLCYGIPPIPFCACYESAGVYSCTDMKGIYYGVVALGDGKFGWWSDHNSNVNDGLKVTCFLEPQC